MQAYVLFGQLVRTTLFKKTEVTDVNSQFPWVLVSSVSHAYAEKLRHLTFLSEYKKDATSFYKVSKKISI